MKKNINPAFTSLRYRSTISFQVVIVYENGKVRDLQ